MEIAHSKETTVRRPCTLLKTTPDGLSTPPERERDQGRRGSEGERSRKGERERERERFRRRDQGRERQREVGGRWRDIVPSLKAQVEGGQWESHGARTETGNSIWRKGGEVRAQRNG